MLQSLECLADKLAGSDKINNNNNNYKISNNICTHPYHNEINNNCNNLKNNDKTIFIRDMKENPCEDELIKEIEIVPTDDVVVKLQQNHVTIVNENIIPNNDEITAMTTTVLVEVNDENSKKEPDPDTIKMFIGQIPKSMDEIQLKKMFEEYGRIHTINVLRDKITGVSKGCCFVTYFTRKAALRAQDALHNIKTLSGMHHPIQMKPADSENRNERKLFVGMLNKKYNESDVRQLFSGHGVIEECTVLRDQNGQSKGCAFVTFATKQCAISAIKTLHQSQTMEGCSAPIVVKFADTQKEKEQKKIQQLQTNLWNIAPTTPNGIGGGKSIQTGITAPSSLPLVRQSSAATLANTQQILAPTQPQSAAPYLPNDGISSASLQLFQQLQSVNLQQQFLHGLNSQPDHSTTIPTTGLITPLSMQNLFTLSMNHLHASQNAAQPIPAQLQNSAPGLWSSADALTTGYPQQITSLTNGPFTQSQIGNPTLAIPTTIVAAKQSEGPEGSNLFIYHLPQEFTDTDLASTFLPFGNILSAKVFIDKQTNLSKCFGFVSYDNPNSAHAAIQAMHGFQIGTKRLKVQLKRSKDAAKPY